MSPFSLRRRSDPTPAEQVAASAEQAHAASEQARREANAAFEAGIETFILRELDKPTTPRLDHYAYNPHPGDALIAGSPDWLRQNIAYIAPDEPQPDALAVAKVHEVGERLQRQIMLGGIRDDLLNYAADNRELGDDLRARISALDKKRYGAVTPEEGRGVANGIAHNYITTFAGGGPTDPVVGAYADLTRVVGYPDADHPALHGVLAVDLYTRAFEGKTPPDTALVRLQWERGQLLDSLEQEQQELGLAKPRSLAEAGLVTMKVAERMLDGYQRSAGDDKRQAFLEFVMESSGYRIVRHANPAASGRSKPGRKSKRSRAPSGQPPVASQTTTAEDPTHIPDVLFGVEPLTAQDVKSGSRFGRAATVGAVAMTLAGGLVLAQANTVAAQEQSGNRTDSFLVTATRARSQAPQPAAEPAPGARRAADGETSRATTSRVELTPEQRARAQETAGQRRQAPAAEVPNSVAVRERNAALLRSRQDYHIQNPTSTMSDVVGSMTELWQNNLILNNTTVAVDNRTTRLFTSRDSRIAEWANNRPTGDSRRSLALVTLLAQYPSVMQSGDAELQAVVQAAQTVNSEDQLNSALFDLYLTRHQEKFAGLLFGSEPPTEYSDVQRQTLIRLFAVADFRGLSAEMREALLTEYTTAQQEAAARAAAEAAESRRSAEAVNGLPAEVKTVIDAINAPAESKSFLEAIALGAVQMHRDNAPVNIQVMLAQALLESGSEGDSSLADQYHNLFGMKTGEGWSGRSVRLPTWEYINGQRERTTAEFRVYDSLADSIYDYAFNFIGRLPHYQDAVAQRGSVDGYLAGLLSKLDENGNVLIPQGQRGAMSYATDVEYVDKIHDMIRAYNLEGVVQAIRQSSEARQSTVPAASRSEYRVENMPNGEQVRDNLEAKYDNVSGRLADNELQVVDRERWGGHRLYPDAAASFRALNEAFKTQFGRDLTFTDSYRDYATQVDLKERKPRLAATPGRSNHGWGMAIDFSGAINNPTSAEHKWMDENGWRYGWVHPQWAHQDGSKPEPWHFEWEGSGATWEESNT